MSKSKKNKIAKLTDEQYYQYITSLKNATCLPNEKGNNFDKDEE